MIAPYARRTLAAALTAATLSATMMVAALPAAAADDPLNLGALQATPSSGVIDTTAKTGWLTSLATGEGQVCPAGFRSRSGLLSVIDGTLKTTAVGGVIRSGLTYGDSIGGVNDGETHVFRTGNHVSIPTGAFPWDQVTAGSTVELRHTCQAATAYAPTTDPYYSVTIVIEAGGAWSVVEASDDRTDTTTTLESSDVTATSVTLSASVAPSEATGTVTFKNGGTAIGDPVALTGGAASIQVSGLSPSTAYAFTAHYSGDSSYQPSSGSASVTTPAVAVADTATATATVTVPVATSEPQEPTGLKISVEPGAVTLTGPAERAEGQAWTATGQLGNVTVNDDRQDATSGAWTLNGKSSAFTSGTNTIAASNLGWTPSKVTGPGSAGATATDLSSDRPLATGTASADPNVATTVNAGLTLLVPATAANGAYAATLTLTLI